MLFHIACNCFQCWRSLCSLSSALVMVLHIQLSPEKSASSVTMGESSVEAFHQGSALRDSESFLHMIRQNELQDAEPSEWLTGHGSNLVDDSQPSFPIDQHLDTSEEFVIHDHEQDFPGMPSDLDVDSCGGETEETVECHDAEETEIQAGQSNVGDDSLDHMDLGDDSLDKVDIEACVNSALQSQSGNRAFGRQSLVLECSWS